MEKTTASVFATLSAINVNEHVENKNGLAYLSWPWAYATVKNLYPDMTYEVRHWDGKPFLYDEDLGYMIETSVTIQGETLPMWLPVMDSKNKSQLAKPYTYTVSYRGSKEEKTVEAAKMFDVNTAIMRCLVKNLAMFGLGLYIYAGEDLPAEEVRRNKENAGVDLPKAIAEVKACKTTTEVSQVWDKWKKIHPEYVKDGHEFYKAATSVDVAFD